jgi:hypothetical protein
VFSVFWPSLLTLVFPMCLPLSFFVSPWYKRKKKPGKARVGLCFPGRYQPSPWNHLEAGTLIQMKRKQKGGIGGSRLLINWEKATMPCFSKIAQWNAGSFLCACSFETKGNRGNDKRVGRRGKLQPMD